MNHIQDRNYLIIINPRSGKGTKSNKSVEIRKFLDENGANYEIKVTEKRGDAEDFAKNGAQNGFTPSPFKSHSIEQSGMVTHISVEQQKPPAASLTMRVKQLSSRRTASRPTSGCK